jgi:hypothetical protein
MTTEFYVGEEVWWYPPTQRWSPQPKKATIMAIRPKTAVIYVRVFKKDGMYFPDGVFVEKVTSLKSLCKVEDSDEL